jgi:hypothetical protein
MHASADDDGIERSTARLGGFGPTVAHPATKQVVRESGLLDVDRWPLCIWRERR